MQQRHFFPFKINCAIPFVNVCGYLLQIKKHITVIKIVALLLEYLICIQFIVIYPISFLFVLVLKLAVRTDRQTFALSTGMPRAVGDVSSCGIES